eukprot:scaffold414_cov109-Cylindrotheca_fusiformis.AAC.16
MDAVNPTLDCAFHVYPVVVFLRRPPILAVLCFAEVSSVEFHTGLSSLCSSSLESHNHDLDRHEACWSAMDGINKLKRKLRAPSLNWRLRAFPIILLLLHSPICSGCGINDKKTLLELPILTPTSSRVVCWIV